METDARPLPPRRYSVKEPTAISNHWPGVCAIEGGVVKCWPRSDEFSWLKNIPRRLKTPVRAVAVSADFACALDELGVLCWGNDDHGQVSKVPELEKPVALASSAFRHKFAWGGGSFGPAKAFR